MKTAKIKPSLLPPLVAASAGVALFHFFGNAARGYIDTPSLFIWWGRQWLIPASETQHGPLVVLVAVWLLWRNVRRYPTALASGRTRFDVIAVFFVAVALHVLGYAMEQTRISAVALLLFIWSVLRLYGGRRWSRAAVFPLGFIMLAIPVSFLQPIGFYLRLFVTETAESFLHLLHVGVVRNGTQLFAPDGRYQYDVAAACSGVRSLVALFALSLLVGYVRISRVWGRALLLVFTAPFAFAGNFLRITAIVLAGQLWGQGAGERVHDASGFLVFAVVFVLLLMAVRVIEAACRSLALSSPQTDVEPDRASQDHAEGEGVLRSIPARGDASPPGIKAWRVAGGAVVLVAAATLVIQRLDTRAPQIVTGVKLADNGIDPAPLPEFLGNDWIGQRVDVTRTERELLPPDTGYSRRNYVSIADRGRQVFVSIVLSGRDRSSIHRPELCVIGQGWNVVQREERSLRADAKSEIPVTLLRIERDLEDPHGARARAACWLAYWFVGRDAQVASHAEMVWRSSLDRLLHFRADRWAYVIVQTPATGSAAEGLRQMEEVVWVVWPEVARPSQ